MSKRPKAPKLAKPIFTMNAAVPSADCFHRTQEAAREFSFDQRRIARSVIDYACAILVSANTFRPERRVRDLVTSALLRRATITTEGVRTLISAGLMEPAAATHRTLLDIEIAFNLIVRDPTDRMARRLALKCAQDYQQHGEGILRDPQARTKTEQRSNEIRQVSATYKQLVNDAAFDDVRAEVRGSQYWHGYKNVQEAFRALDRSFEYAVSYDGYSWFVHGVNIEHDLSASNESGPALRPLVERDPQSTLNVLGLALLKLIEICGLYLGDRGIDPALGIAAKATVRRPDGVEELLTPLQFLQFELLAHFDVRSEAPLRPVYDADV